MKKLLFVLLFLPLAMLGQTNYVKTLTTSPISAIAEAVKSIPIFDMSDRADEISSVFGPGTTITKVVNGGPGVGNFNLVVYTPLGVTTDTVGLIMFPGSGQSGTDPSLAYVNGPDYWLKASPTWQPGMVIVFAQTPSTWGPDRGAKPLFVQAVLKELLNGGYHIDRNRFTLTGLSWGAAYIFNYMQYATDADYIQPAAVVAMSMSIFGMSGDYNSGTDALSGTDSRWAKVPAWFFCGSSDTYLQPMLRYQALQKKAGVNIPVIQYAGGHCCWNGPYSPTATSNNIYPWIMQQAVIPPAPVIVPPIIIPAKKSILSVTTTYLYADSTKETIIRP